MDEARPTDRERSLEPRTPDLHVQIEQVSVALQQLRHTQESLNTLEARLSDMTRDCAAILDGWARNDEKHATAVVELHSRLSEWNEIERRLLNESTTRIHQFERSLQHEWTAIRQAHEEPIRQLDAQTTRIAEACLTAVDHALRRFDAAEARLASLEEGLHREIDTLTREVREAVTDLRRGAQPQLAARQPWSIDNVVRLHNELRGDGEAAPAPALVGVGSTLGVAAPAARGSLALAGSIPIEAEPERPVPAAAAVEAAPATVEPVPLWRRTPVVAAAVVAVLLGGFGVYLQSQVQAGLRDAAARAEAAERGATEVRAQARHELDALQKASDERLLAAQEAARAAQTLAAIAAASDLRRFDLVSRDRTVAAQALVSATQGIAFSAPNLPPPPAGKAYQLWLIGPDRATSAGVLPASGRATFATPSPLPRPIVRASITLEPAAGSALPTSAAYLISPVAARPPSTP